MADGTCQRSGRSQGYLQSNDIVKELITISGSGENDSFLYVQIITESGLQTAHVWIFENGVLYSGSFDALLSDNRTISCGPLLIELRIPFRKWRINFRGYLNDNEGNAHFVSISGWWRCVTNARFFYSNAPLKAFADVYSEKPTALIQNLEIIEKWKKLGRC